MPRSWGTDMAFRGTSPWTDREDLGIRTSLLNYSEDGGLEVGGAGGVA